MRLANSFKYALQTLLRNRSRSILTSIGIIIGISSVIMIIGLTSSAKIAVKSQIYSYGANGMSVRPKSGKSASIKMLSSDMASKIISVVDIPDLKQNAKIKNASYMTSLRKIMAVYRNARIKTTLFGADNDYVNIQNRRVLYGRLFNDDELVLGTKVVIIGDTVRRKFFGFSDPVNKIIVINEQPFRVIGSFYGKGKSITGEDFDNTCIIPYRAITRGFEKASVAENIYVQAVDEQSMKEVMQFVDSYYRVKCSVPAGYENVVDIDLNSETMEVADKISQTLAYLLVSVAIISLIVGGIGIMNIMLVSVSERTREIGIRMAIGAKSRDILVHFLIEAITLCALGGFAGILLGLFGYWVIVLYLNWSFQFSPLSIIISFTFACMVGLFFGFYPAKRASRMNPIEALRFE